VIILGRDNLNPATENPFGGMIRPRLFSRNVRGKIHRVNKLELSQRSETVPSAKVCEESFLSERGQKDHDNEQTCSCSETILRGWFSMILTQPNVRKNLKPSRKFKQRISYCEIGDSDAS